MEVSVSLRNILEIDEHKQVNIAFFRVKSVPKLDNINAVMVCKCNLHLDGKKHISCQSFGDEGAGKVAIAIKERNCNVTGKKY